MRPLKPFREQLPEAPGSSWSMLDRRLDDAIPFQWHHHPEFELTLTLNSHGQRFIGDHVGGYADGDLVLVGPNLPHTWASRAKTDPAQPHRALVLWFHPDWIARSLPHFVEFRAIDALLARAGPALAFSPRMAASVREDFAALFDLAPLERLMALLRLLDRLAGDEAGQPLSSASFLPHGPAESRERIDRVLRHLHSGYDRVVPLDELADVAALSVSGLHRMFRKHAGTTVSAYLARLRIGDACARLSGTSQPVAHIAQAVGYETLANFNRQFKALRSMTPREYRAHFRRTA